MSRRSQLVLPLLVIAAGVGAWVLLRPEAALPPRSVSIEAPLAPASAAVPPPVVREAAKPTPPAASKPDPAPATPRPAGTNPGNAELPPIHNYLPDRTPDEILPDGTVVYHNYPFQMKQPDGTFKTVPSTVTFKPVPAVPMDPPENPTPPRRN